MERVSGLEELGNLGIYHILSKLDPEDVGRASCVSKRFKTYSSEDSLWAQFCFQDLQLSSPIDHQGNSAPSFKAAYGLWREAFCMYPYSLVKRVKRCWDKLEKWLSNNLPEALPTLRRGASEYDIERLETRLKVKLPLTTRLIYRFHDGQELPENGYTLGIMGGYSFYDHSSNVHLLPIWEVIRATKGVTRCLGFPSSSKLIVVAIPKPSTDKLFVLNCKNGQLYVGTKNLHINGEMIQCVPHALIRFEHESRLEQQQDAMLLWLEEYGRLLENGVFRVREEGNTKRINLFPEVPPLCSSAITNGVQVRASAVFVPEGSDLQEEDDKYFFAYSIRMSLLPGGCTINGMTFSSCQLERRHWIIRANDDTIISNVNAEAVIGKHPLLFPGEDEFVYQSCSTLPTSSGCIEGYFTFVPGSMRNPQGTPFKVEVARFPLQLPDYIY